VIGRQIDEITEIAKVVMRALSLGLLPAFILTIFIAMFLSKRVFVRVTELNRKIQHVVTSDLRERLPTSGRGDTFDQIAVCVNQMLGDIESLVREIAAVGDNIAHDLRTPLTRVRVRLERGRARATSLDELRTVVDQAIGGLDQSLAIITALLRIAEIEHSRRLEGFSQVPLGPLVREIWDLYEPIAEDKSVTLRVNSADETTVHGDRDLLFEAAANLVDNAIKFTPEGGHVDLTLLCREDGAVVQVRDTGPGISESEREAVTKRFYRSDKSRRTEGLGLGLSLVAAIVKLHGFQFVITAGPGCTVEIICPQVH
jgi:signal transduction histidine kinase